MLFGWFSSIDYNYFESIFLTFSDQILSLEIQNQKLFNQ